jgi:hypothetical protein
MRQKVKLQDTILFCHDDYLPFFLILEDLVLAECVLLGPDRFTLCFFIWDSVLAIEAVICSEGSS